MQSSFINELTILQDRADLTTSQIRELSAQQKQLSDHVEISQSRLRTRQERKQRMQNLQRAIGEMKERIGGSNKVNGRVAPASLPFGDADIALAVADPNSVNGAGMHQLPDASTLSARVGAYNTLNAGLAAHLTSLKSRDTELESKYRKVVALCTSVDEHKVDSLLPQLLLAVESEPENDVGRVREFLKRVEAVGSA
jgi:regulatory protein SWI6